jgi:hypothetical protein
MLTLEQIKTALADRRLTVVAESTGLHYNTLRDIRDNPESNPSYRTLKAVSEYLEGVSQ